MTENFRIKKNCKSELIEFYTELKNQAEQGSNRDLNTGFKMCSKLVCENVD